MSVKNILNQRYIKILILAVLIFIATCSKAYVEWLPPHVKIELTEIEPYQSVKSYLINDAVNIVSYLSVLHTYKATYHQSQYYFNDARAVFLADIAARALDGLFDYMTSSSLNDFTIKSVLSNLDVIPLYGYFNRWFWRIIGTVYALRHQIPIPELSVKTQVASRVYFHNKVLDEMIDIAWVPAHMASDYDASIMSGSSMFIISIKKSEDLSVCSKINEHEGLSKQIIQLSCENPDQESLRFHIYPLSWNGVNRLFIRPVIKGKAGRLYASPYQYGQSNDSIFVNGFLDNVPRRFDQQTPEHTESFYSNDSGFVQSINLKASIFEPNFDKSLNHDGYNFNHSPLHFLNPFQETTFALLRQSVHHSANTYEHFRPELKSLKEEIPEAHHLQSLPDMLSPSQTQLIESESMLVIPDSHSFLILDWGIDRAYHQPVMSIEDRFGRDSISREQIVLIDQKRQEAPGKNEILVLHLLHHTVMQFFVYPGLRNAFDNNRLKEAFTGEEVYIRYKTTPSASNDQTSAGEQKLFESNDNTHRSRLRKKRNHRQNGEFNNGNRDEGGNEDGVPPKKLKLEWVDMKKYQECPLPDCKHQFEKTELIQLMEHLSVEHGYHFMAKKLSFHNNKPTKEIVLSDNVNMLLCSACNSQAEEGTRESINHFINEHVVTFECIFSHCGYTARNQDDYFYHALSAHKKHLSLNKKPVLVYRAMCSSDHGITGKSKSSNHKQLKSKLTAKKKTFPYQLMTATGKRHHTDLRQKYFIASNMLFSANSVIAEINGEVAILSTLREGGYWQWLYNGDVCCTDTFDDGPVFWLDEIHRLEEFESDFQIGVRPRTNPFLLLKLSDEKNQANVYLASADTKASTRRTFTLMALRDINPCETLYINSHKSAAGLQSLPLKADYKTIQERTALLLNLGSCPGLTDDRMRLRSCFYAGCSDTAGNTFNNRASLWNPGKVEEIQWEIYAVEYPQVVYHIYGSGIKSSDSQKMQDQIIGYLSLSDDKRKKMLDGLFRYDSEVDWNGFSTVANVDLPAYKVIGHFAGRLMFQKSRNQLQSSAFRSEYNFQEHDAFFTVELDEKGVEPADLYGYQYGNDLSNIYVQSSLLRKMHPVSESEDNLGQIYYYSDGRSYVFFYTTKDVTAGQVLKLKLDEKQMVGHSSTTYHRDTMSCIDETGRDEVGSSSLIRNHRRLGLSTTLEKRLTKSEVLSTFKSNNLKKYRHIVDMMTINHGLEVKEGTLEYQGEWVRGLFATRPILKDSYFTWYDGTVKPISPIERKLYFERFELWSHTRAIGRYKAILGIQVPESDVGGGSFINDPRDRSKLNSAFVELKDHDIVLMQATRDIQAGEEIFASYGNFYWRRFDSFFKSDETESLLVSPSYPRPVK